MTRGVCLQTSSYCQPLDLLKHLRAIIVWFFTMTQAKSVLHTSTLGTIGRGQSSPQFVLLMYFKWVMVYIGYMGFTYGVMYSKLFLHIFTMLVIQKRRQWIFLPKYYFGRFIWLWMSIACMSVIMTCRCIRRYNFKYIINNLASYLCSSMPCCAGHQSGWILQWINCKLEENDWWFNNGTGKPGFDAQFNILRNKQNKKL